MIYITNALLSTIYFYNLRKLKKVTYLYFMPILLLWTVIIGGQYDVGTDYFMYRMIFENSNKLYLYFIKKEYLFYYYVIFLKYLSNNPQFFFMMTGLIQNFLLVIIIKKLIKKKVLEIKYTYIFILIYLTAITVFYNQMNGLRQYFNIYLFSLGIIYMLNRKKIKYCLINLIAIFIHRSSYLLLPFYLIYSYFIKKNNKKYFYFIILLVGLIISLIDIKNILEIIVLKYTPKFSGYFLTERIQEVSLEKKIVKYVYLPFYFCAINLIEKRKGKVKEMIKIGVIGYSIRIAVSNISIVNRIGEYFIILSIFPIYYLIEEWLKQRKNFLLLILIGMICGIFFLKVTIFAKGEYFYRFYLFN